MLRREFGSLMYSYDTPMLDSETLRIVVAVAGDREDFE
jgi:hypothetical protein